LKQYKEHLKEDISEGYRYLTKEEFKLEVAPEIETQMKEAIALEAGVSMAFLGGLATFRGYRAVTKPIISYKIPKPVSFFQEVKARQPILRVGKEVGEIPISTYKIITKVPPQKK